MRLCASAGPAFPLAPVRILHCARMMRCTTLEEYSALLCRQSPGFLNMGLSRACAPLCSQVVFSNAAKSVDQNLTEARAHRRPSPLSSERMNPAFFVQTLATTLALERGSLQLACGHGSTLCAPWVLLQGHGASRIEDARGFGPECPLPGDPDPEEDWVAMKATGSLQHRRAAISGFLWECVCVCMSGGGHVPPSWRRQRAS